jgi:iron complex transport system substrate-binding protein
VSQMQAAQQHRFVVMDAQSMNPTIRTIDGIEVLANRIRALGPIR